VGDSSDVGIRTYSSNAEIIMIATNNSNSCSTVTSRILVIKLGATNDTTLILSEILMRKTPSTLDVNDSYTRATASWYRPREFCIYPTFTWGFQILLVGRKTGVIEGGSTLKGVRSISRTGGSESGLT
jgi:hypothetical protein